MSSDHGGVFFFFLFKEATINLLKSALQISGVGYLDLSSLPHFFLRPISDKFAGSYRTSIQYFKIL